MIMQCWRKTSVSLMGKMRFCRIFVWKLKKEQCKSFFAFLFKNPLTMIFLSYGLLGASGCGKTTLLSCIVGRKKVKSGNIYVFGDKIGDGGSTVLGPCVGYMPQV